MGLLSVGYSSPDLFPFPDSQPWWVMLLARSANASDGIYFLYHNTANHSLNENPQKKEGQLVYQPHT